MRVCHHISEGTFSFFIIFFFFFLYFLIYINYIFILIKNFLIIRLGADPEKLFPYKVLQEHFRKYAKFGLILSTVLLPMMTSEDGYTLNIDEIAENIENGVELDKNLFISKNSHNKFNERLRDVVIDMVRLGYI